MNQPAELPPPPAPVEYAAWRYWAALVRDRAGPHRGVGEEVAASARTLAHLLDLWEDCSRREESQDSARNLTDNLETTIEMLVSRILAAGVAPPPVPSGRRPYAAARMYRETIRRLKETSLRALQTWHELAPADRERLLNPVAILASVARTLTQAGGTEPTPRPAGRDPRSL